MPDKEQLAQIIADEIARQHAEPEHGGVDNLGDCETIIIMSELATVNVVELAERILEQT